MVVCEVCEHGGPCPHACRSPGPIVAWKMSNPGHPSHCVLSQQGVPALEGLEEGQEGARLGDRGLVSPDSALRWRMTCRLPTGEGLQEGKGLGQVTPVRLRVAAPGRPPGPLASAGPQWGPKGDRPRCSGGRCCLSAPPHHDGFSLVKLYLCWKFNCHFGW